VISGSGEVVSQTALPFFTFLIDDEATNRWYLAAIAPISVSIDKSSEYAYDIRLVT